MKRRKVFNSEIELQVAVDVFHEMRDELLKLMGAQANQETEFPWIVSGLDEPDEGAVTPIKNYERTLAQIAKLRQEILNFPQIEQMTIMRQEETKQKRGETVLAHTVYGAMQEAFIVAKKYVPQLQRGSFDADMKDVLARFAQANPGALLGIAGDQREEQERQELEGGEISHTLSYRE